MTDIAHLTDLIEPEAKALGFDLVRVQMMPSEAGDGGQALQIMVAADRNDASIINNQGLHFQPVYYSVVENKVRNIFFPGNIHSRNPCGNGSRLSTTNSW